MLCKASLSGHSIFAENSEQVEDKWSEVGPSTHRGANYAPSSVVWAPEVPPVPEWNWTWSVVLYIVSLIQVSNLTWV